MSRLANINDNFLFHSIYLNIFTGLLTVHFSSPDIIPKNTFKNVPFLLFNTYLFYKHELQSDSESEFCFVNGALSLTEKMVWMLLSNDICGA